MAITLNGTTGITDVNGTAAAPAITGTDTDSGVYFGTNTVGLSTNGTAAVSIDASQNVTLNNVIPSGSTAPTNGMFLPAANSVGFATNSTERARIDSSGNLSIGSAGLGGLGAASFYPLGNGAGSATVQVFNKTNTTSDPAIQFRVAGTTVSAISYTSTVVTYGTTSDYRLKTVIGAVTDSGTRIDALEPIEYIWNSNGQRTRGFLAHKFQEVYADSVTGTKDEIDADGKPVYQGMQAGTAEVIADLVAEIQSLRKRLAALEAK